MNYLRLLLSCCLLFTGMAALGGDDARISLRIEIRETGLTQGSLTGSFANSATVGDLKEAIGRHMAKDPSKINLAQTFTDIPPYITDSRGRSSTPIPRPLEGDDSTLLTTIIAKRSHLIAFVRPT